MRPEIPLVENSSCIDAASSSSDNRIAVATDKCVYVLEQTHNASFRFDFLNFSKEIVKEATADHHVYDLGVDVDKVRQLPKGSYVQQRFSLNGLLAEKDSVSPHAERFSAAKLSPVCDDKDRSILATVSYDNRAAVYHIGQGNTFTKVANLSEKLYKFAKKTGFTLHHRRESEPTDNETTDKLTTDMEVTDKEPDQKEPPDMAQTGIAATDVAQTDVASTESAVKEQSADFKECERRFNSVSVTGLEWSRVFPIGEHPHKNGMHVAKEKCSKPDVANKIKGFILLATALKSNHVIIWKFSCPVTKESTSELATVLHTDDRPTALHWCDCVTDGDNKAYLAIGGYEGRITIWGVSVEGDVTAERELDVWEECDEIPIQGLTWVPSLCTGESFVLVTAKGPCMMVFQIHVEEGNMKLVHQSHTLTMHTAIISGMCSARNKVYTSSTDGSIQVAQVTQEDGISVDVSLLEEPKYMMKSRINGMCVSPNGIYLTTLNRHYFFAIRREKSELKFHQIASDQEAEETLLDPKVRLCSKFDCMDWLYPKLSPNGAVQDTAKIILSDDVLANRNRSETLHFLKLRRFVVKMMIHRMYKEMSNSIGRRKDQLEGGAKAHEERESIIADQIFKLHAENALESFASAGIEEEEKSERAKRVTKLMSDWLKMYESQTDEPIQSLEMSPMDSCESCRLCGENIPLRSRIDGSCKNGHRWKRCSLSLLLCQTLRPSHCAYCKTFYASQDAADDVWLHNLLSSCCLWCDGPLVHR